MSKETPADAAPELPTLLSYTPRERARAFVRGAFPRRKWKVIAVRDVAEFKSAIRRTLIDAALVDVGSPAAAMSAGGEATGALASQAAAAPSDDTWKIASLAHEYPSAPFFGISPLRATDAPAVARCAALEFCDVLADGIDDPVARDLVAPRTFTARFMAALSEPPSGLGLRTEMQLATWRSILSSAGRPVRTAMLAREVGVSREHLSRHFSAPGAPNLKRVIDLTRVACAAQLLQNSGYRIAVVVRLLHFASSSHLAGTVRRIASVAPSALGALGARGVLAAFARGNTRSRW